ncbi:MAG: 1-(5-phosphoribosyl)-5-[(5-phosphoribosylamino)methylideneamino]imidazole-4-carboxamide isomerase [Pseudomonadales bacterium]
MLLIPTIDLKGGQCVRLRQGRMEETIVFSSDPAAVATRWVDSGARRLHVVDLDGAFAGAPRNATAVRAILESAGDVEVEVGGGIRELATVEELITVGADYVVLGSSAVSNPEFVREAARQFPKRIILGLDTRDGLVAVEGWAEVTELTAQALLERFGDTEIAAVVYTDIARDGMMGGLNVEATVHFAEQSPFPVIASGGVRTMDDLESPARTEPAKRGLFVGAISGRALYEGTLDFGEGQKLLDSLART